MKEKKAKKVLEHVKITYDNIAEEFSQSRHYAGKEFPPLLPYLKKARAILDLGCGNGRFVRYLEQEKLQATYIGIDNSQQFVRIAQELHPHQKFMRGDQLNIPLQDQSVDLILNMRAFHHIPSKTMRLQALGEMKRVTKKNGIIIISVWNLWQKKYWKQLITALLRSIFTLGTYAYNDTFISWKNKHTRYYHAFTKKELQKVVEQSELKVIDFLEVGKDYIIIAQQ